MIIKIILLIVLVIIYMNPKIDNDSKIKMLSIILSIVVITMPNYKLFFEGFKNENENIKQQK